MSAFDLRGHGGSGGRRGYIERWTGLSRRHCGPPRGHCGTDGRPVVLFAHSLGGLVTADYVLSGRPCRTCWCCRRLRSTTACRSWQHILVPLVARMLPTLALKIRGARRPCLVIGGGAAGAAGPRLSRSGRRSGWARSGSRREQRCRGWPRWPCRHLVFPAWTIASCHPQRPSPSRGCLASPGVCTQGFGARSLQRAGGPAGRGGRHRVAARGSGPAAGRRGCTLWGVAGSGGKIRTYDQAVNSRPLYH